jgi:hypothetical protein
VARQIARRAAAVLNQEQRALIKQARDERLKAEELQKRLAQFDRERATRQRREARVELAERKRALRAAGKKLAEKRRRDPGALPEVPAAIRDAWIAGDLSLAAQIGPRAAGGGSAPDFTRHLRDSPPVVIPLPTFCDMIADLAVAVPPALAVACESARGAIVRHSPWRAVGWDRPPDWPPGAPGMAPWLAARASHTLTALPRLLAYPEALEPADETWALAQGVSALRILAALGVQDTFSRLAPHIDQLTARAHPRASGSPYACHADPCLDTRCGLPMPECNNERSLPLRDYLHATAATLGPIVDRRMRTWTGAPLDQLRAELYATFTEDAWTLANDGACPFEYGWPPELAAVMACAHFNRWPPPATERPHLAAFLDRATQAARAAEPRWPTLLDLEECARATGFELVPGLHAD